MDSNFEQKKKRVAFLILIQSRVLDYMSDLLDSSIVILLNLNNMFTQRFMSGDGGGG